MVTTNARSQAVLSRSAAAGKATIPAVRSALYTAADRKETRLNGFLCSFLPTQTAKPTSVSLVPQGNTKADENCNCSHFIACTYTPREGRLSSLECKWN